MKLRFTVVVALAVAATTLAFAQAPASKTANLRNPAAMKEMAPATYKAKFDTSKGAFVVEVHRDWAPIGADRFYNLVKNGFYDDTRFFRVIDDFMVQWGLSGTPSITAIWRSPAQQLKDDPVKQSNKRGFITFATAGPNTRTTQVFINFRDNSGLDRQGFAPFGQVTEGMAEVVDKLYSGYAGRAQDQFVQIMNQGNAFLNKEFPKLDYVKTATIQ
jgi:peptidyl-prolyl cis-trans isomerase A (cyclophilin A)